MLAGWLSLLPSLLLLLLLESLLLLPFVALLLLLLLLLSIQLAWFLSPCSAGCRCETFVPFASLPSSVPLERLTLVYVNLSIGFVMTSAICSMRLNISGEDDLTYSPARTVSDRRLPAHSSIRSLSPRSWDNFTFTLGRMGVKGSTSSMLGGMAGGGGGTPHTAFSKGLALCAMELVFLEAAGAADATSVSCPDDDAGEGGPGSD